MQEATQTEETEAQVDRALDHALQGGPLELIDPYVLQGSASTTVEKIALKYGDAFMVADSRGDLPETEQETGFFWHGTRFLRPCDLFVEGRPLVALSHSTSDEEGMCQIDLSNPFIALGDNYAIYQGAVHVRRTVAIDGPHLTQVITLTNFDANPVELRIGLKVGADFRDIFEIRGLKISEHGTHYPPDFGCEATRFRYLGRDGIERETSLAFEPAADRVVNDGVFWTLTLGHTESRQITVTVTLTEQIEAAGGTARRTTADEAPTRNRQMPVVESDNVFFNQLLRRGMHDLMMMCTQTPQGLYPYGGIPWYVCPFGRDALITALEFLPWFPEIARGTLGFLAANQGTKVDPFTEEEPGRILHEYRRGEMANCRDIPFIPYYGTVDATPLFLVLLEQYVRWTNDLDFLRQLWPNAQAAANWLYEYGDCDGDTFIEYHKISSKGLVNQGWKDSWDAISYQSGDLAEPPIALCEVQGYAYAAYHSMDYLAGRLGRAEEGQRWRVQAEELRANFLRSFWWEEERTLYLALDGGKNPCKVVSSNAGQCLWSGIVPDEWAEDMIGRLMRSDMYTEWGIRTLSSHAARYNPMSYHNGSVWPHDTAMVGAGFARYGRPNEAGHLLGNLYGASLHFEGARLPELFCGFARRHGYGPTRYPVACSPQSWAAGAPFLLLSAALGLQPEAEQGRLTLRRPTLPSWLNNLEIRGLRLGDRRAHLRFERNASGSTGVNITEDVGIDINVVSR